MPAAVQACAVPGQLGCCGCWTWACGCGQSTVVSGWGEACCCGGMEWISFFGLVVVGGGWGMGGCWKRKPVSDCGWVLLPVQFQGSANSHAIHIWQQRGGLSVGKL